MKTYGGVEVQLHVFLSSALEEGVWLALRPGDTAPGTHCTGGWVGPRVGLDKVEKRIKYFQCPYRESNPGRPSRSLFIILIKIPWRGEEKYLCP
jgi:hypothetical protein